MVAVAATAILIPNWYFREVPRPLAMLFCIYTLYAERPVGSSPLLELVVCELMASTRPHLSNGLPPLSNTTTQDRDFTSRTSGTQTLQWQQIASWMQQRLAGRESQAEHEVLGCSLPSLLPSSLAQPASNLAAQQYFLADWNWQPTKQSWKQNCYESLVQLINRIQKRTRKINFSQQILLNQKINFLPGKFYTYFTYNDTEYGCLLAASFYDGAGPWEIRNNSTLPDPSWII